MLRLLSSLGVLVAALAPLPAAAQQRSLSEFVQVAPDVYAFRFLGHVSMFLVGSDGVAVVDPIGQENVHAPSVLKQAIASVTDLPVKYYVDLTSAIREARAAGQADNSEAMLATVRDALAGKYGTWANFPNGLGGNVSGAIRWGV